MHARTHAPAAMLRTYCAVAGGSCRSATMHLRSERLRRGRGGEGVVFCLNGREAMRQLHGLAPSPLASPIYLAAAWSRIPRHMSAELEGGHGKGQPGSAVEQRVRPLHVVVRADGTRLHRGTGVGGKGKVCRVGEHANGAVESGRMH